MKRTRRLLLFGALWTAWATPGFAQVPDHLKCYKVKDPQPKTSYLGDLGGLVPEPGCTIKVPARFACVPVTKSNVEPAPPGGGAAAPARPFACYKVKCPKAVAPDIALDDQFGSRTAVVGVAKLLCAPLATTTSTSTTTSSTTSTTTCDADGEFCGASASCCSGCCDANGARCASADPCCDIGCVREYCIACDGTQGCVGVNGDTCRQGAFAHCCP